MHIKLPFDSLKPVSGEASIEIEQPIENVFHFIGHDFFDNYPRWATEVVEFEPLDGKEVFIGAKSKQVRRDANGEVSSVFEITDFKPRSTLIFQGISEPYRHSYFLETSQEKSSPTRLTFRFELLEIEVFMRPFEKLIRYAIEEGAENTVENINNLILAELN